MNWDAFGAVAELVGATAVVVTLVFFAKQIRHLHEQSANTTSWSVAQALSACNQAISADAELADIWLRGRQGLQTLSDAEALRFSMHAWSRINIAIYVAEHEPAGAFSLVVNQMSGSIALNKGYQEVCAQARDAMPPGLYERLVGEST